LGGRIWTVNHEAGEAGNRAEEERGYERERRGKGVTGKNQKESGHVEKKASAHKFGDFWKDKFIAQESTTRETRTGDGRKIAQ